MRARAVFAELTAQFAPRVASMLAVLRAGLRVRSTHMGALEREWVLNRRSAEPLLVEHVDMFGQRWVKGDDGWRRAD
jgi:hypothetical protein